MDGALYFCPVKNILTFCFVFLMAAGIHAAEGEKKATVLTGKVCDAANLESLAGAEVSIPELGIKTLCDFDGKFQFEEIPTGTYTIEVRYISYREAQYVGVEVDAKGKLHKFVLESL